MAGDARPRRGRLSELVARTWLRARGWSVVGVRVELAGVEVDLIATRGRVVALVEVKSRRGPRDGPAVAAAQWRRLERAARAAAARPCWSGCRVRLDLVEVHWLQDRLLPRVRHVPEAHRPGTGRPDPACG